MTLVIVDRKPLGSSSSSRASRSRVGVGSGQWAMGSRAGRAEMRRCAVGGWDWWMVDSEVRMAIWQKGACVVNMQG